MYVGDGADKKVKRIDKLKDYILKRGKSGVSIATIIWYAERHIGLDPKTAKRYLRILQKGGEIKEHKMKFYGADQYNT